MNFPPFNTQSTDIRTICCELEYVVKYLVFVFPAKNHPQTLILKLEEKKHRKSIEPNALLVKGSHPLPNRMFSYTLCRRPLTPPPPLGFTQSCCGFFRRTFKKCVNVCCKKIDKLVRKSVKRMSKLP